MTNAEGVEKPCVGIAQKGEIAVEALLEPPRNLGGVDADGIDVDTRTGDSLIVTVELDELDAAERSPIAAVENIERRCARRSCSEGVRDTVLVDERISGEWIADGDGQTMAR